MKKIIIIISIVLFILAGLSTFGVYTFYKNSKTNNYMSQYFIIKPETSSADKVLDQLGQKGIIKSSKSLQLYMKLFGQSGSFQPANYLIKPGTSYKDLLAKLQSGNPDFAIVTIPEGYSLFQIYSRLVKYNLLADDTFLHLKLKDVDPDTKIVAGEGSLYELEGFLFPDTYYIPYGTSPQDIAKMMNKRFNVIFNEKDIEKAKELNLTINQVITIASLIEKEAAFDSERSRIAGVIYNRLKKDMLLQIDAAVIYANTKGEKSLEKVLNSHLKFDSKYNTYMYKGLPPGPIASPGRPSIEAALNPENNDYLYYVAGDKGHVFSKTYEEHLENVKKYIK